MDKENDISGSFDCVFKVPMDPNSLKSQKRETRSDEIGSRNRNQNNNSTEFFIRDFDDSEIMGNQNEKRYIPPEDNTTGGSSSSFDCINGSEKNILDPKKSRSKNRKFRKIKLSPEDVKPQREDQKPNRMINSDDDVDPGNTTSNLQSTKKLGLTSNFIDLSRFDFNILPGNRTSSSDNDLPQTSSTPVRQEKKKRKSREEDEKLNNLEEGRIAPVKLVPTLGMLESLEQLGSLEELERFALFPNKKLDFDHCVPSKCEELIKWIGDFLPEANRDMVSSRLRALMNHDEIQETSTGHVVVSREFRAKIRSKSVPEYENKNMDYEKFEKKEKF